MKASTRRGAAMHSALRVRNLQGGTAKRCVANEHCQHPPIPDAPVAICGKHLRELYEFASDMVTERWDSAVREYVSDLHGTFKPPRAVRQPLTGWVYFIRFGDRIKVGFTTNPDRRLKDLPHEEVLGVMEGSRQDEAGWHALLADYRTVGEWFRAEPEVIEHIRQVVARSA